LEKRANDEKEVLKKDMDTLKNIHKTETDDLYNRNQMLKRNSSNKNSDEAYLILNNELENSKQQINFLIRENMRLKKDNESLLKEKNTLNINYVTLNNKLAFDEKKNGFEINKLKNNIENLKSENNSLKNDIQLKDKEIQNFFNEKMKLKNKISSKEMECLELKNEINILNGLLNSHQESLNNNIISNYKNKKEMILEEKKMEDRYKKEIDELNMKLRGTKNMDDLEDIINDKDEEINKLKNKIKQIENDVVDDLKYKYKEAIKKKQLYKSQCKEANQKIEKLYKRLTPEQQKDFQNIFNIENSNINNNNNFFEVSQSGFV
jgi:chromosome segregation ATPase